MMQKIEENNRKGKTGDLFKKIGDIKGIVHVRMDTIKDRNSKDLIETEDIKNRWQEYTEELLKKIIIMSPITTIVCYPTWKPGVWSQVDLGQNYWEQSYWG